MSAAHPGNMPPSLVVINSELQGQRFSLGEGPAQIGRGRECEIQIDLASISRKHAVIEQSEGRYVVRDLGSRNGVKLAGRPVDQAELHDGDVITVGRIELRFESPPPAAPLATTVEDATEAAPIEAATANAVVPGRALTVSDIVAAAQSEHFTTRRTREDVATQPGAGLNVKLIALVIIAFAISVAVGGFILWRSGQSKTTGERELPSLLIKAGGNQWLSLARSFGDFSNENISIADETVADARKYDTRQLVIHALAGGTTTVRVTTNTGRRVSVRVFVRGRIEDPLENLAQERFTNDAARRRRAQGYYEAGQAVEAKRPYLALQEYRKAETVLKPISEKGALYLDVKKALARTGNAVETCWKTLESDARVAIQNKNLARVQELFDDALELIPDPNDPRHQKVAAHKQRLIDEVLKKKKGRRG